MAELNENQEKKLEELVSIGLAESAEALLEKMINDLWQERFAELSDLSPEAIDKLREMHEGIQRGEGTLIESREQAEAHFEALFQKRREEKAKKRVSV